jgi:hypothetical protein
VLGSLKAAEILFSDEELTFRGPNHLVKTGVKEIQSALEGFSVEVSFPYEHRQSL